MLIEKKKVNPLPEKSEKAASSDKEPESYYYIIYGAFITLLMVYQLDWACMRNFYNDIGIRIFCALIAGLLLGKLYINLALYISEKYTFLTKKDFLKELSFIHSPLYLLWLYIFHINTGNIHLNQHIFPLALFLYLALFIKFIINLMRQKKITFSSSEENRKNLYIKLFTYLVIFILGGITVLLFKPHSITPPSFAEQNIKILKISDLPDEKRDSIHIKDPSNIKMDFRGCLIELGQVYHKPFIEMGLSRRSTYSLTYYKDSIKVGRNIISTFYNYQATLSDVTIKVPNEAVTKGYNSILMEPWRGDPPYIMGYIKLCENSETDKSMLSASNREESSPPIESLYINLTEENFEKITHKRDDACSRYFLLSNPEDDVPAVITCDGKDYNAEIRLKGDGTEHLILSDKWSFRVKIKGNKTLFGMKRLSLHKPEARNGLNEWIYHKLLDKEGIINLRYDFVKVFLNEKYLGVYALEEHFGKRLIENNRLREGIIVKFDEDFFWTHNRDGNQCGIDRSWFDHYYMTGADAFQLNKIIKNPNLYNQFLTAVSLIENFREGKLSSSEVFDLEKMARYMAIVDLVSAQHNMVWINRRYYYNPVTSHLEPIGFDGNTGKQVFSRFCAMQFVDANFFYDENFIDFYIKTLRKVSAKAYLDEFFNEIEPELEDKLKILKDDNPDYKFSKDIFYRNQEAINIILNPAKIILAYFGGQEESKLTLSIGNISNLPVEIVSVSYGDETFPVYEKTELVAKKPRKLPAYKDIAFSISKKIKLDIKDVEKIKVNYKVAGFDDIREEKVFPWEYVDSDFLKEDLPRKKDNIKNFDFLTQDKENKVILISQGKHTLEENLIVPEGYKLICYEGTEFNLLKNSKILSYSPLEFSGTEEYPIKVTSSDGTGQGLLVINAKSESNLNYVIFDGLSNPKEERWSVTGAVTFYESPVNINYCSFKNNASEDGLNIIRSKFAIENSLFENIASDAFDGDFTEGTLKNCAFINCINDCIDVSGSEVTVTNVSVEGSGDKGISAGENSRVTASNIKITNAKIALGSKDMSQLIANNVELGKVTIAMAAYQKKPEFGPATIKVQNISMNREMISLPYLIENKSTVIVDGTTIVSKRKEKEKLLLKKLKLGEPL